MAAMSQPPLAPAPFSSAAPPAPSLPSGTASGGSGRGAPPSVLWGAAPASSASGGGGGSAAPLSKYKVVFVGDQGSGKTSIIKAFIYGSFDYNYKITVGIDFLSKTMYVDERPVRLQIWDSAGQERFRSLIPSYIRDSSVAVVVYDVTSECCRMLMLPSSFRRPGSQREMPVSVGRWKRRLSRAPRIQNEWGHFL